MNIEDRVAIDDYFDMLERVMRTNTHLKQTDRAREISVALSKYEKDLDHSDLTFLNICRHYINEQLQWKRDIVRQSK
jgi:uncharacterized Zn finger protein